MKFTRRGFFGLLASAIAGAATLDPEKLLWLPGRKVYSLPPARIIANVPPAIVAKIAGGNRLLSSREITEEVLKALQWNLRTMQKIAGQYTPQFIGDGLPLTWPAGEPRPNRFRHAA